MPRKPRFFIPDIPVHIVQRGRSREPVFFENSDYLAYLGWLKQGAARYRCAIHAYVLMTNHVHILATPSEADGISRLMQYVGRRYVLYINHCYRTSGSLWEGRYKASLVQEGRHFLACMRYIELNPVRANMARFPSGYRWSSYACNALGLQDALVSAHPSYLGLGHTPEMRMSRYKDLFSAHLDKTVIADIQSAWQTGTPLGNDYFREKIEAKLGCKVGHARRGNPNLRKGL